MLEVKTLWQTEDFEDMGWHDAKIYSIILPNKEFELSLDIDYIFKWDLDGDYYNFWVSPCSLKFFNVSNLVLNLKYEETLFLFISDIHRFNKRLSPNRKFIEWDYEIECDNGTISFSATDFKQEVRKQPVLSKGQNLSEQERM